MGHASWLTESRSSAHLVICDGNVDGDIDIDVSHCCRYCQACLRQLIQQDDLCAAQIESMSFVYNLYWIYIYICMGRKPINLYGCMRAQVASQIVSVTHASNNFPYCSPLPCEQRKKAHDKPK